MLMVKDIMSTQMVTAGKDLSIFDAAELLVSHHITGIPIVDHDGHLIGILSEYDVLRVLKESAPGQEKTVNDFMTKNVMSFEDTTPMVKVWEFFIDTPTKRRVPITSGGKLVGLVSRGDIVKQIIKIRRG
ncbi:MAG: CBS domain-containing protein [Candidatus Omnitrophica bacterium]|nr:CBS domain-containing protein [Candidatus Omnitrophota bacterium]